MTVRAAAAGPSPRLGGDAREPPRTRPAKRTCGGTARTVLHERPPCRPAPRDSRELGRGLLQRPYALQSENSLVPTDPPAEHRRTDMCGRRHRPGEH